MFYDLPLSSVTVAEDSPYFTERDGLLYTKDMQSLVYCPREIPTGTIQVPDSVVTVKQKALENVKVNGLTIVLPETVKTFEPYAFAQTENMIVNFPQSLQTIANDAFYYSGLSGSLVLPSTVETIGEDAFINTKITQLTLPSALQSIGEGAFENCSYLTGTVTIPSNCTTIEKDAFTGTKVSSLYIGASVSSLGISYKLSNLTNVGVDPANEHYRAYGNIIYSSDFTDAIIYSNAPELRIHKDFQGYLVGEDGSFYSEGPLSSLNRVSSIVVEEGNARYASFDGMLYNANRTVFLKCPQGRSADVTVADSAVTIRNRAFYYIKNLKRITLGSSVKTIEGLAFYSLDALTDVVLNEGIRSIGEKAFSYDRKLEHLNFPNTLRQVDDGAFSNTGLTSAYFYPGVSFGNQVFDNCKDLLFVHLPDDMTILPSNFFYGCIKLATVELPSGLTKIGSAFTLCRSLSEIHLPQSLKVLDTNAFNGCSALNSIDLPEGLQSIGKYAFYSTGIETLIVPKSVQIFDLDPENFGKLKDITFLNKYISLGEKNHIWSSSSIWNGADGHHHGTVGIRDIIFRGFCGSKVHEMAVKQLVEFVSIGHSFLDWFVAEPATFDHDGLEKRTCAYCGESEERGIPKLKHETYTATFMADGKIVGTVDFQRGAMSIDEPKVPARDRYTGKWEDYTLNNADLTIHAVYTLIKSDDAQEIETESTIEHYPEKDDVLFRVKATASAKTVKSIVSQSMPLDIVLVVDQSGSMDEILSGEMKKVDALKNATKGFIRTVAENAKTYGADHRIAIVGFGRTYKIDPTIRYENTELLTGARGVVNYGDLTLEDYASALLPVLNDGEQNPALNEAVEEIDALGATAADHGMNMAKEIFANSDSTDRERVVVFLTDGEPTHSYYFDESVANSAIRFAYTIKNVYKATIYSIGIFETAPSETSYIGKFMNAISSNCPKTSSFYGFKPGDKTSSNFYYTVNNTQALNSVFKSIPKETFTHTAPFDNVTLIKTLSKYVTLTAPQEETLRLDLMRKYSITNDQISVTRDEQGRTQIRIDGLTPYEVTDDEGNVSYEVAMEFFASLNENAAAGTYTVDTEDSGIMLGANAMGYEATFDTNELTLSDQKIRYIFTINGEPYEIAEGSTVAAAVPEADFAADWQFSGWNTTGVSNANGTIVDATLVKASRTVTWHTADGDTQQVYMQGQFLTPPEVPERVDGSKFLSWDKSLPTIMLDQDLEFTAVYGPHIHRYVSKVTTAVTCTEDGVMTYTCNCGDSYIEVLDAIGHNYEAATDVGADSDPTRCTFVCVNCADRYEYSLQYYVESHSKWGSRVNYEFALTDDNLQTGFQPDGMVEIYIPLSDFQHNAVFATVKRYVDGRWEPVPAKIEDGFLVITADHFTPYEVQFNFSCNETGNHSWDQGKETKTASCTEKGEMTFTCTVCETTKTEDISFAAHTLKHVDAKAATTEAEGNVEYYHCTVCGKNFSDANGTNELSKITIDKLQKPDEPTTEKPKDDKPAKDYSACKYCGEQHTGAFGWLIKIIHSILALFGLHK